ncbi:hypothetical protein M427DRAFT_154147 [Gonapodya prolifera JEL478]|uniref:F-box domain-containing protein n=1 Tax=Gonapodya prolifera (strain JEL478) TaxID=1344416 RepID=A0A139AKT1_GONPJ|nr:hypothetical protein M427DRAFT_154147 [Gonapodya prolifera JEL478]|eukprot:KXS17035.1 hypothetical protein M427DRAFT_154147 [Gonapodya prolifera JEL478]
MLSHSSHPVPSIPFELQQSVAQHVEPSVLYPSLRLVSRSFRAAALSALQWKVRRLFKREDGPEFARIMLELKRNGSLVGDWRDFGVFVRKVLGTPDRCCQRVLTDFFLYVREDLSKQPTSDGTAQGLTAQVHVVSFTFLAERVEERVAAAILSGLGLKNMTHFNAILLGAFPSTHIPGILHDCTHLSFLEKRNALLRVNLNNQRPWRVQLAFVEEWTVERFLASTLNVSPYHHNFSKKPASTHFSYSLSLTALRELNNYPRYNFAEVVNGHTRLVNVPTAVRTFSCLRNDFKCTISQLVDLLQVYQLDTNFNLLWSMTLSPKDRAEVIRIILSKSTGKARERMIQMLFVRGGAAAPMIIAKALSGINGITRDADTETAILVRSVVVNSLRTTGVHTVDFAFHDDVSLVSTVTEILSSVNRAASQPQRHSNLSLRSAMAQRRRTRAKQRKARVDFAAGLRSGKESSLVSINGAVSTDHLARKPTTRQKIGGNELIGSNNALQSNIAGQATKMESAEPRPTPLIHTPIEPQDVQSQTVTVLFQSLLACTGHVNLDSFCAAALAQYIRSGTVTLDHVARGISTFIGSQPPELDDAVWGMTANVLRLVVEDYGKGKVGWRSVGSMFRLMWDGFGRCGSAEAGRHGQVFRGGDGRKVDRMVTFVQHLHLGNRDLVEFLPGFDVATTDFRVSFTLGIVLRAAKVFSFECVRGILRRARVGHTQRAGFLVGWMVGYGKAKRPQST